VLLALGGALAIAFSGILVRLADVEPSTAAFYRCAYAVPFLIPLAVWERRTFGPRQRGQAKLAWIAGLFFAADLVLWHHAIAAVGAGLATVIANTQVVIVGLTAWVLLGERPSGRLLAAVPVVLAGIVLISGVVGADAYGDRPGLGVVLGIGTALAYSGFLLVLRAGNRDRRRPAGPLLDATIAAALGSAVAGVGLGELDLAPSWPAHGWLLLLAVSAQVIGWLLITASLPRLPAAVSSVLLTAQPAATVLLAMLIVDENPSVVQLAGVLVVIAGVASVAGRRQTSERSIAT
jgi:drug/metabolite transporter (DMT)-like permease